MVAAHPSVAEVWQWLGEIPDPELPALSIVDLGIVRDVQWADDQNELVVSITPTYSGCPAMEVIANDIRSSINEHGIQRLKLRTQLSPPWTTDWLSDQAKERLRAYGIAPPPLISITTSINCPHCGSDQTQLVSRFGSTACKALYKCLSCLEPFDAFKRH
jgi:ring-1,2-phenylacetyl-CoA epoxidase subunit PaaD